MPGLLSSFSYNPGTLATYTPAQQQATDPTFAKLDAANLVFPAFTTGSTGLIRVVFTFNIIGNSTSGDTLMKMVLLDAADNIIAPGPVTGSRGGRRIALHHSAFRRGKFEFETTLTPNTQYTPYIGAGIGNQVQGVGTGTFTVRAGGGEGAALGEIWDLAA